MAYVRSKQIKGHTYYYLVEGRRVGGKVQQRVLAYLGKIDPSQYTAEDRAELAHESHLARADETTKQVAYDAFKRYGITVRHNITRGRDWDEEERGRLTFFDGKAELVTFEQHPSADTVVHELGHLVDYELQGQHLDKSWFNFRHFLKAENNRGALEEELLRVGRSAHLADYIQLMVLDRKRSEGELSDAEEEDYQDVKYFFKEYVLTAEECFANGFAQYILHPERAKETSPLLCQLIEDRMGEREDLQQLLRDLQSSRQF